MLKLVHGLGRRTFLAIEFAFNRIFGEKLNPFYYLGAISYFMFWVVVASGFYIYVFYETGVDTTFSSVERLTHTQWFAGGVMRSLHRYASDAMVLTMLLHLARHFFFDRYRGFRAFSWITGVILIWLIYVSGVNGYMLPWDQLAQYVVVTTAEWFDVLPAFRGTMVRNFALPAAITDRLFSLLSFLHIGIPLAALAALWIHTQRVPRARTLPPRPLAIGLMLMLLALSLIKPAVSQGAADFSRIQSSLAIDWFYLAPYPWVTSGHAVNLWWIVGGATVLLALAPWLPPIRRGAPTAVADGRPSRQTQRARADWRNAAGRGTARAGGDAVRMSIRRLWRVPCHGVGRRGRSRCLPVERAAGRSTCTWRSPAVLRLCAVGCRNRTGGRRGAA